MSELVLGITSITRYSNNDYDTHFRVLFNTGQEVDISINLTEMMQSRAKHYKPLIIQKAAQAFYEKYGYQFSDKAAEHE